MLLAPKKRLRWIWATPISRQTRSDIIIMVVHILVDGDQLVDQTSGVADE